MPYKDIEKGKKYRKEYVDHRKKELSMSAPI